MKKKEKSIEQQREEFLAREARECKKWQQPTEFQPEHNASPELAVDDLPETSNIDEPEPEGETESNEHRETL